MAYLARRARAGGSLPADDARISANPADRDRTDRACAARDRTDLDGSDLDWATVEGELRRLGAEESVPLDLVANIMRRVGAELAWIVAMPAEHSAGSGSGNATSAPGSPCPL